MELSKLSTELDDESKPGTHLKRAWWSSPYLECFDHYYEKITIEKYKKK